MNSHVTDRFRKALDDLPDQVRRQARSAYRQFKQNPHHPGLRFKQVHPTKPIYSVHISEDYRALGIRDGQDIVWYWIGGHEEYDKLIDRL